MEDVPHCAELVILHGHAGLQLRDHHTYIVVYWLKGLQLQLALCGGRGEESGWREGERKRERGRWRVEEGERKRGEEGERKRRKGERRGVEGRR